MSGVKRLSWRMKGLGMLCELLVVPFQPPVPKRGVNLEGEELGMLREPFFSSRNKCEIM